MASRSDGRRRAGAPEPPRRIVGEIRFAKRLAEGVEPLAERLGLVERRGHGALRRRSVVGRQEGVRELSGAGLRRPAAAAAPRGSRGRGAGEGEAAHAHAVDGDQPRAERRRRVRRCAAVDAVDDAAVGHGRELEAYILCLDDDVVRPPGAHRDDPAGRVGFDCR